ncbi:uncharacterized protein LOC141801491 isoform X2 [Halichoeres trimaculatus]|uniref:uncharacterized protein LOC141801491 isoform X2 n=1 Tax=Halichoeres trimaculatus TaxID=147232 RepID=UPI003D9E4D29
MSSLLSEIQSYSEEAVSVLRRADFSTDADIKTLTPLDLNDLFPGRENFKLRKRIFKTVHKHGTNHELVGEGEAMSSLLSVLRDLEEDTGVLTEFCTDADIKTLTRQDLNELFPEPEKLKMRKRMFDSVHKHEHNDGISREDKTLNPEGSPSGVKTSASSDPVEMENAQNDDVTQREPGAADTDDAVEKDAVAPLEKSLNISASSDPVEMENTLNGGHTQRELGAADTDDAVEKDAVAPLEKSVNTSTSSAPVEKENAQIGDHAQIEPGSDDAGVSLEKSGSTSASCDLVKKEDGQHENLQHITPEDKPWNYGFPSLPFCRRSSVFQMNYKKVVSGETFGADKEFMEKVEAQLQAVVQLTESIDHHQITVLFCPIISRVGSDVEAAMSQVTDGKPVILVLMHHSHEPKVTTSVRTWDLDANYPQIILHADVFFHNTACGLLQCKQNDAAINQIQTKLREFCSEGKANTSGQSNNALHHQSGRSCNTRDDDALETEPITAPSSQEVKYKKVVSGETFGADQKFMEKVKAQLQGRTRLNESRDDHQITILFCPITSRVGSDVEAAMSQVTDDKPVILVLMHHSHEPKVTTSVRTWDLDAKFTQIIFHADVSFHSTAGGLLHCKQNEAAIIHICSKLRAHFPPPHKVISGQSNQFGNAKKPKIDDNMGGSRDNSDENRRGFFGLMPRFLSNR